MFLKLSTPQFQKWTLKQYNFLVSDVRTLPILFFISKDSKTITYFSGYDYGFTITALYFERVTVNAYNGKLKRISWLTLLCSLESLKALYCWRNLWYYSQSKTKQTELHHAAWQRSNPLFALISDKSPCILYILPPPIFFFLLPVKPHPYKSHCPFLLVL